jgi:hypothetical protein
MLEKYLKRHEYKYEGREDLDELTLLEFAKCWEVRGDSLRKRVRAAERAVRVFPWFNRNPENEEYEDFCRTKLMLHHPFDTLEDLTKVDPETGFSSYSYAFRQCAELHQHPRDPLDPLDGEDEEIDDDLEDADEHPDPGSQPAFAELAARTGRDDRGMDESNADLGTRTIDQMYESVVRLQRR